MNPGCKAAFTHSLHISEACQCVTVCRRREPQRHSITESFQKYRMAEKLLCLCLLLALLCSSLAKKKSCWAIVSNCDECIQSDPQCAWCTDPGSYNHCSTLKGLQRAGCNPDYVYNPQGLVQVVKNDSSTEPANTKAMFLQPQEFSLRLRPGVSQSFPLTITMPTEQTITELTMDTSPLPAGVNITFSSIVNRNPHVVQVNVEAAWCPHESNDSSQMQNRTGPWSVHITPRGFSQSVKLEIKLECQCNCSRNREENSLNCLGHGTLVCGRCQCHEYFMGKYCQLLDIDLLRRSDDNCRPRQNAPLCSGRGKCMEGDCECEKRVNPDERYTGKYCECSNFDCPYSNNRLCGGHGRCECGHCICDEMWTGDDCSCSLETASCMASNQMICNGRGNCICGACQCTNPRFAGSTCEFCDTCEGKCLLNKDCVECRAFGTGPKKDRCDEDCGHVNVTMVETKQEMFDLAEKKKQALCKMRTSDDLCYIDYTFSIMPSEGQSTVVRTKDCF